MKHPDFAHLHSLLQAQGMACGPDVWLSVSRLCASLHSRQALPSDAAGWSAILGPLFCRNPDEQARFPYVINQWLAQGTETPSQAEHALNTAIANAHQIKSPGRDLFRAVRTKLQRINLRWWALLLLMLLAFLGWLYWPTPDTVVNIPKPTPPPNPVPCAAPCLDADAKQKIKIVDQITPRAQAEPEDPVLADKRALVGKSLVVLPLLIALLWLLKTYHRYWTLRRQAGSPDDLIRNFQFRRPLRPLFGGHALNSVLSDLRSARYQPTRRLNIDATIEVTARNGNYFQPVYQSRRCSPAYLFLIRSLDRDDQQAALAEELTARFAALGLKTNVYRFRDDPRWLVRWPTPDQPQQAGQYFQLAQLTAKHSQDRLLIISATDILFHPYSGEVRPWLESSFQGWPERVWLHVHTAATHHIHALQQQQFKVFALNRGHLPDLVKHLTQPSQINPYAAEAINSLALPSMLAAETDAWLAEKPPYAADLPELLRQLERFIGSHGLRLLRLIAVFPKVQWSLTQALDQLVFEATQCSDDPDRREQRFTRIARLPWLVHAYLPDWLRQFLLSSASNSERRLITQVWQSLFEQLSSEDQTSGMHLEFRSPKRRQLKLKLQDLQIAKPGGYFNDPIFAAVLLGKHPGLLDLALPKVLAGLLPKVSGVLDVRPLLHALIITAACIGGLHSVWQYAGANWYRQFQLAQINRDNQQWQVTLNYRDNTQALAAALQHNLAQKQFPASSQLAVVSAVSNNMISYPPGGESAARRIQQSLTWLTYGAEVRLIVDKALSPPTLRVELAQTYQHASGFADGLNQAYNPPAFKVKPIKYLLEPQMVRIPPGQFLMGSPANESDRSDDEGPQHQVTIAYAFELSATEITFAQYDQFAEATGRIKPNDAGWGLADRPVINVSFEDAEAYAKWLAAQTGKQYRLPSEAEWEYAARAGTNSAYWWGQTIGKNNAVCVGCGSRWDNKQTARVKSFKANAFGLYDTAGNVWEWTQDCWHDDYQGAPKDGSAWLLANQGDCARRVIRGGSWGYYPQFLRSAVRLWYGSDGAVYVLGFRVARAL